MMAESDAKLLSGWRSWQRYIVYQSTRYRTTWRFRLLALTLVIILCMATRGWWIPAVGWGLVANVQTEKPDLILIDNLDTNFQLFEKASYLQKRGVGKRVLVPVAVFSGDIQTPATWGREIAETLIRLAHLDSVELLPVGVAEPITRNVAYEVGSYLKRTEVSRVLILTSGFKSKRIHLIFKKALSEVGIETYCLPVWGSQRPETWANTWHGIQEVLLQYAKLVYYRLWVLGCSS